jgi:transposase
MYVKHCKLTRNEQLRLMEHFVAGTPARTAAEIVGVHRNSAIRFFHKLRTKIALKQQNRSEQFCGKVELDESYFGGVRKGNERHCGTDPRHRGPGEFVVFKRNN